MSGSEGEVEGVTPQSTLTVSSLAKQTGIPTLYRSKVSVG